MRLQAKFFPIAVALMLLAMLQCAGLHWSGLFAASKAVQSYKNFRTSGLTKAIQQLPQGKGNCGFCKKIKTAKASEDRQQREKKAASQELQGLNFILGTRGFAAASIPTYHQEWFSDVILPWQVRGETPPTPPPRVA